MSKLKKAILTTTISLLLSTPALATEPTLEITSLSEAPKKREKPKVILTYDTDVDSYYIDQFGSNAPTELNKAMERVNAILAQSGSKMQLDWQVVKTTEKFVYTPENYRKGIHEVISEQDWYKNFVTHDLGEFYVAIYNWDKIPVGGGSCIIGIGYEGDNYQNDPSWINDKRGCSVEASTLIDGTVLAHELAHYFGTNHDRYQLSAIENKEVHDYSIPYGYVDLEHEFITIMSYNSECNSNNIECIKVPVFSNPDLLNQGTKAGVSEDEVEASNVAKFLSYSSKDLVTNFKLPTSLNITFSDSELLVDWADVAEEYVLTSRTFVGTNESNEMIWEEKELFTSASSVRINRDFYRIGDDDYFDYQSHRVEYTLWGLFKNDDVRRRIELGKFRPLPRLETASFWEEGQPRPTEENINIRDLQLGIDKSAFELPVLGDSFSFKLTLPEEESSISNDTFFVVTDYAECNEPCNQMPISYGIGSLDNVYGAKKSNWLTDRFDISVSGSGVNRTVTFTSKQSYSDWMEYAYQYINSQDYSPSPFTMFKEKQLPIRLGFQTEVSYDTRIIGSAEITIDLSNLYNGDLVLESLIPYASIEMTQNNKSTILISKEYNELKVDIGLQGNESESVNINLVNELPFTRVSGTTSYKLDLSDVEPKTYYLGVEITNNQNNTPSLKSDAISPSSSSEKAVFSKNIAFTVVEEAPTLSADNDSDNDGLSDLFEGTSDSDSDGSPDYLDSNLNRTGSVIGFDNQEILAPSERGQLWVYPEAIKNIKKGLVDSVVTSSSNLINLYGDEVQDNAYVPFTEYFLLSAKLASHFDDTDHLAAVVPLPSGVTLPANAILRNFTKENGWASINNNMIYSSQKTSSGKCPEWWYQVDKYTKGLTEGDECVYFSLSLSSDEIDSTEEINKGIFTFSVANQNNAPVINEISNLSVNENESVSLTVTASDADSDDISYRWEQLSGKTVTLSNVNTSTTTFTAPEVSSDETLSFKVYASDGIAETSKTVQVTVKNIPSTDNSGESSSDKDSGGSGGSMGWILGLLTVLFASRRKALN